MKYNTSKSSVIGDNPEDFLLALVKQQGHAHSDFDSELDKAPWDEYNKVDVPTSLESKLAKKLN